MNMIKATTALALTAAANMAAAAVMPYALSGNLTSYAVIFPGSPTPQLETIEPTTPFIDGNAIFDIEGASASFDIIVNPEYDVVRIDNAALAVEIYAGMSQRSGGTTSIYDPATQYLSGTGVSTTTLGIGSYCTGITSVCSALYSETLTNGSTATFDITFGNSLESFVGTLTVNSKLSNGGWIIRTYNLTGVAVPLPMSGLLFGSAMLISGLFRRKI